MKKFIAVLLFALVAARLWSGPITIEEKSVDRGSTVYREKRWLRDGETILVESWITEKATNSQQIHLQVIRVAGKSLITFSQMKEFVAVTSQESEHVLAFGFSPGGVLDRVSILRDGRTLQAYGRRSDGFYSPVEEPAS